MKRRNLLLGLASAAMLAATAGAAFAASFAEDVVAQLGRLGFSNIRVGTTLLGRVKIVAARGDGTREIVLNPRTGEILRDVWFPSADGKQARSVLNDIEDDDEGGNDSDNDGKSDDEDNSGHGSDGDDGQDDTSGSGGGSDDDRDREDRGDRNDD